jgi:hypothetical protein
VTAAEKYLARLYEDFIDANLDVEAIRHRLADRGVLRSPAMVRHELDNVYHFHGYAASHPAVPVRTLAEIDGELGR